jgi:hypothetical protein
MEAADAAALKSF